MLVGRKAYAVTGAEGIEGVVLRYLTDAYRTLRQTVPESHRSPQLEEVVEWLGETVRQTDSSLLDEWEALRADMLYLKQLWRLVAERAGTVSAVKVTVGDVVQDGDVLVVLD